MGASGALEAKAVSGVIEYNDRWMICVMMTMHCTCPCSTNRNERDRTDEGVDGCAICGFRGPRELKVSV